MFLVKHHVPSSGIERYQQGTLIDMPWKDPYKYSLHTDKVLYIRKDNETHLIIIVISDINVTDVMHNAAINECDHNPCQHGGECTDDIASFTCNCPAGYDGDTCNNSKLFFIDM